MQADREIAPELIASASTSGGLDAIIYYADRVANEKVSALIKKKEEYS